MLDFVLAKITKRRNWRRNRFTPCTSFENGGGLAGKSSVKAAVFGGGVQHFKVLYCNAGSGLHGR